jgi:hypothetical protein
MLRIVAQDAVVQLFRVVRAAGTAVLAGKLQPLIDGRGNNRALLRRFTRLSRKP